VVRITSHGVEISMAGCVEEMVHVPNPKFFYFFYFLFMCVVYLSTRYKHYIQR